MRVGVVAVTLGIAAAACGRAAHARRAPRSISAVVDERPPVAWNGAVADGLALVVGEDDRFVARADGLRLAGHRTIAVARAPGGNGFVVRGIVDVLDDRGAPIARDRAIETRVDGRVDGPRPARGRVEIDLLDTTWDGRPDPLPARLARTRRIRFEDATLVRPSRRPDTILERRGGEDRPVGGGLAVRASTGSPPSLRLWLARPDGSRLSIDAVTAEPDGVIVRGSSPSYGRVALAIRGSCRVTGGGAAPVRRRLSLWITPDGVARVTVDGVLEARFTGTRLRPREAPLR